MQDNFEDSRRRLMECYQDFLMWILEYLHEKKMIPWHDMGFIGHFERTQAAVRTHMEILERETEPKSRNATDDFKSRRNNRTLYSKALNRASVI